MRIKADKVSAHACRVWRKLQKLEDKKKKKLIKNLGRRDESYWVPTSKIA